MNCCLPTLVRWSAPRGKAQVWNVAVQQQQQQPFNGRLSGTTRVGRYQKKHSPALAPILVNVLPLSPFSICNGPWHPLYSAYVLDSPLEQPLSRSSLVFPLVLNPQFHTPCISCVAVINLYLLLLLLLLSLSVLWCCWLGDRKGIRPVKNRVVGCWRGYLSGARCRLAYGPADATVTRFSKIQIGFTPFWYRLTRVVPEKRPLNGCVCVCTTTTTATDGPAAAI